MSGSSGEKYEKKIPGPELKVLFWKAANA